MGERRVQGPVPELYSMASKEEEVILLLSAIYPAVIPVFVALGKVVLSEIDKVVQ
jgi:hypothetical protein